MIKLHRDMLEMVRPMLDANGVTVEVVRYDRHPILEFRHGDRVKRRPMSVSPSDRRTMANFKAQVHRLINAFHS